MNLITKIETEWNVAYFVFFWNELLNGIQRRFKTSDPASFHVDLNNGIAASSAIDRKMDDPALVAIKFVR